MSVRVVLRRLLPEVIVTWFVTSLRISFLRARHLSLCPGYDAFDISGSLIGWDGYLISVRLPELA
jgi:hypothetical protein